MINKNNQRSAFTITFNTTEDCNLRCKYCYEDILEDRTGIMTMETSNKIFEVINEEHMKDIYKKLIEKSKMY